MKISVINSVKISFRHLALFALLVVSSMANGIEPNINIKMSNLDSGYIMPKFKAGTGTYLKVDHDLKEYVKSAVVPAKPNVAIGSSFNVESSMGKKLQIAILLTKPIKKENGSGHQMSHLTFQTIRNGGRINSWYVLRPETDRMKGEWRFRFFLVAIDRDIIRRPRQKDDLRNAILIHDTTFALAPI